MQKRVLILFVFHLFNNGMDLYGMEQKSAEDSLEEICNYDLFKTVQKIRDIIELIIDNHLSTNKNITSIEKGREGWPEPNSFYSQTKNGLFLHVIDDDRLHGLWTPWGNIKLLGGIGGKEDTSVTLKLIAKEFFAHFETKLHKNITSDYGCNIKLYKLLAFDGIKLPEPLEAVASKDYTTLKDAWKKLDLQYKAESST